MKVNRSDIERLWQTGKTFYDTPLGDPNYDVTLDLNYNEFKDASMVVASVLEGGDLTGLNCRDLFYVVYHLQFENPVEKLCELFSVLGVDVDTFCFRKEER